MKLNERIWFKLKKTNKKEKVQEKKQHNKYDKGQIFVKVTAGVLAILMVGGTAITLVYALM